MTDDSAPAPTRVVLYTLLPGHRVAVAAFRRQPDGAVTLDILDTKYGPLAQHAYDHGTPSDAQDRLIHANEDPEGFMRALLEPRQASYYAYIDESGYPDRPAASGPTRPATP